jgi:hypothetical protein
MALEVFTKPRARLLKKAGYNQLQGWTLIWDQEFVWYSR